MKVLHLATLGTLATVLLGTGACRPDQPATTAPPAATSALATPSAPPEPAAAKVAASRTDTLHLPGGRVVQLRPTTAAAFEKLPFTGLPELLNDPSAERLPAGQGHVRRQGLALLLRPGQGPEVRLASTPEAQFTLQNGEGVKYMYWGSLPAAHQWAVRAWAWEAYGTVLVDQRTGHRLKELPGDPVAAPDGRLVLFGSPGLGGGDQPNALCLVQIEPTGTRLLWQIEPTTWEPAAIRWAAPNRAVLMRRHALPDGSIPDDARVTYDELTLPPPH
jgi:hypothetical protein